MSARPGTVRPPRPGPLHLAVEALLVTLLVFLTAWSWRSLPATEPSAAARGVPPSAPLADLARVGDGRSGISQPGVVNAPVTAARVVIIVGPAGDATDRYRARAEEAALVARGLSSDVRTIYSPNATWEAVREALQGASIVVYLGHGNGWPSPHRSEPFPQTQNGLGLNPVAGGGDAAHQYFGEAYLREQIRLAPGAIVLLHYLCYASGTSEPGVPEGDLDTARQRVDNFAAGWLATGARAVVAEARVGPAWYVEQLLTGSTDVRDLWAQSPARRGNVVTFDGVRTAGSLALLDPDTASSGYYRSLVIRSGPTIDPVAAAAVDPPVSLAALGIRVGLPVLDAPPLTGATARVTIPLELPPGAVLPEGLLLSTRWDPVDVVPIMAIDVPPTEELDATDLTEIGSPDVSPTASAAPSTSDGPSPSGGAPPPGDPSSSGGPPPSVDPSSSGDPSPSGDPSSGDPSPSTTPTVLPSESPSPPTPASSPSLDPLPGLELIAPAPVGDLITPASPILVDGGLAIDTVAPEAPGRYRLAMIVHAPDGRALDAASQALVPGLLVRVSLPLSARVVTHDQVEAPAAGLFRLPITIANTGRIPWDLGLRQAPSRSGDRPPRERPSLIARWVDLDADDRGTAASAMPISVAPGTTESVELAVIAPTRTGRYLLVLDVRAALFGSLTASGSSPAVVRVVVVDGREIDAPAASGTAL